MVAALFVKLVLAYFAATICVAELGHVCPIPEAHHEAVR